MAGCGSSFRSANPARPKGYRITESCFATGRSSGIRGSAWTWTGTRQSNEPRAIKDTARIKTGKTTFPWWNGFYEEKVPFKPGLNTATAKHYIDFCAEAGIPYHSLDGVGNTACYGGPIVPYKGADPTKAIEGLDLPEVLKYAKAKGVKIRLWMNWGAAEAHMEKAFPIYRDWGIEGVMLDFMDRDDQAMNRFLRKAVKLAAENKLTVTLHVCPMPTGLARTYRSRRPGTTRKCWRPKSASSRCWPEKAVRTGTLVP